MTRPRTFILRALPLLIFFKILSDRLTVAFRQSIDHHIYTYLIPSQLPPENMADPQHHDALKLQAEAALKRLEEARLHERCPKACKSCSQKHRKCQFKNGHYPKCDLCAKNNRVCEIIPTPVSHSRRSDETQAYSVSQQQHAGNYGFPSGPTQSSLGRPHRTSVSPYAGESPSGSRVDMRNSSATPPGSYGYSQSDAYPYHSTASQLTPGGHSAAYSSPHNQQGQYAHYPSGHNQLHGSNPSTQHDRETPSTYYVPSQNHSSPSLSNFTPGSIHWSEVHGSQPHAPQTAMNPGYGYSGSTHSGAPVRHGSAPAVPQIHTGGQSYIRSSPGYQVTSPTSPGSSYGVAGSSMYQVPSQNTSSVRYGAGSGVHGYDQSLNSSSPGSVNESGMYYHSGMPH